MKINMDDYKHNRQLIKTMLETKDVNNYKELATNYAVGAGCPIMATYYFMGELLGFSDELVGRMQDYAKFYGYTGIVSKNDIGHSVGIDKELLIKRVVL